MKAVARRASGAFAHRVEIRHHHLVVDEPDTLGGDDEGPTPQELLAASLAACTAITLEMYLRRKDWDITPLEVSCDYASADRDEATRFILDIAVPPHATDEQIERVRVIAAKCPVHRTLTGEVTFEDHVRRVEPGPA